MTHSRTIGVFAALAAIGLLAIAAPAQAIYLATPMHLSSDAGQYKVGDEASFTVTPENETVAQEWAGRTLQVRYGYDKNEGQGPSEDGEDTYVSSVLLAELKLDEKASATFKWTIPAEVDDRNVDVTLFFGEEAVAFNPIAIGDAEPRMYAMSGPGKGAAEQGTPPEMESPPADTGSGEEAAGEPAAKTVPGIGMIALVGTLGAAALGVALARRK